MDDSIAQAFGGDRIKTPVEEAWHNEQRRKQYDVIRVAFPKAVTVKGKSYELPHQDFFLEYDTNQYQRIVWGTTIDIPHYIAIRYVEHKKNDIVNFVAQQMHDAYLAERDAKGLPRYTDKHTENKETYENQAYPKTDDPQIIAEVYDQLWLGLVHEFGRDIPPTQNNPRAGEVDLTPTSQKIIDSFKSKRVAPVEGQSGVYQPQHEARPPMPQQQPPVQRANGFADLNKRLTPDEVTNE